MDIYLYNFQSKNIILIINFYIFQEILVNQDFSKFQGLKPHLLVEVDKMLTNDIAKLMAMIPLKDIDNRKLENGDADQQTVVKGLI